MERYDFVASGEWKSSMNNKRRDNEPLDVASISSWLSTAVVCGTDMFFLTIGRPAVRLASPSAGTEVMGFLHMFADARMPICGVSAILCNFLLVVLSRTGQRWFYLASALNADYARHCL